jgi:hypothetical protein
MRRLVLILLLLSQAGCTAMLIGGGEAGEAKKDCNEYPDQAHCE